MMIADYNLKALVFDDRENEAQPLMNLLNYERIPHIYINFKVDTRDDKKVQNVRIVFADLIIGEYSSGDTSSIVEAIRASILDNISVDNGPFILVAWSKHSELVHTLKSRILEVEPKLNFIALELNKLKYFERKGDSWDLKDGIRFENISSDISEQLKELEHLEVFLEWENNARNSISKVLNNFLDNISVKNEVEKIVSSTIKSTLGKKVSPNSKDKLNAFYHTLNSTLADSIDNDVSPENKHDKFLSSLDLEHIDSSMKALINRKTLFETPTSNKINTGNIYCFNDFKNTFYGDIVKDVCGFKEKKIFEEELFEYRKEGKLFEKEISESQDAFQMRHLNEHAKYTHPLLLEFTPSCDIAQGKYEKSRLIFGYLVDSRFKCLKKECDSLYITDFHFQFKDDEKGLSSNYRLVFFIKHIFAVNPEKVKQMIPILRARKEFATDLQHAIANHISRIGISSIDGF